MAHRPKRELGNRTSFTPETTSSKRNDAIERTQVHQTFRMPIGPRNPRRFRVARQPRGRGGAIRPICTPRLPSSHTYALDFFLAGEAYDLIASDRWWFGAEVWAARTKRLGSRHLGRQVVGKCRVPRSAIARTVAYRYPRRSISIRCRAAPI
jgi:hypothetical protein